MGRTVAVEFTEGAKYLLLPAHEQKDWNKLIGYGGLQYSFKRGIRKKEHLYAWRYYGGCFEIAEYWRKNWKFEYRLLYKVYPGEKIKLPLKALRYGLPLGGYFGGNKRAPTDLRFYVT